MDVTLTIISIICTIASIIGAIKSIKYFKKSKQLTIYANTNVAYTEIDTIKNKMIKLLSLANKNRRTRGLNLSKEISENGEVIKNSIEKIRNVLPVDKSSEFEEMLFYNGTKTEEYIDTFITGTVLTNDELTIDDDFKNCQQVFVKIQIFLKKYLDEIHEKLK